jgi:hypothetical protein
MSALTIDERPRLMARPLIICHTSMTVDEGAAIDRQRNAGNEIRLIGRQARVPRVQRTGLTVRSNNGGSEQQAKRKHFRL